MSTAAGELQSPGSIGVKLIIMGVQSIFGSEVAETCILGYGQLLDILGIYIYIQFRFTTCFCLIGVY